MIVEVENEETYEYDDVLRFKLKGIVAWEWNEAMLQPFADKYGENYKVVMSREERVIG